MVDFLAAVMKAHDVVGLGRMPITATGGEADAAMKLASRLRAHFEPSRLSLSILLGSHISIQPLRLRSIRSTETAHSLRVSSDMHLIHDAPARAELVASRPLKAGPQKCRLPPLI